MIEVDSHSKKTIARQLINQLHTQTKNFSFRLLHVCMGGTGAAKYIYKNAIISCSIKLGDTKLI